MSQAFKKVLVANRGEIAMRIFRACHDLGLQTIAIYSNEDVYSLFRTAADESYLIGENESPLGAYLDIPRIIELAKKHGADAIHPGFGFLSENADFAEMVEKHGITFIGPTADQMRLMGDKITAPGPVRAGGRSLPPVHPGKAPVLLQPAGGEGGEPDLPAALLPEYAGGLHRHGPQRHDAGAEAIEGGGRPPVRGAAHHPLYRMIDRPEGALESLLFFSQNPRKNGLTAFGGCVKV